MIRHPASQRSRQNLAWLHHQAGNLPYLFHSLRENLFRTLTFWKAIICANTTIPKPALYTDREPAAAAVERLHSLGTVVTISVAMEDKTR